MQGVSELIEILELLIGSASRLIITRTPLVLAAKEREGKKKRNWVGRPTRLPAVTASHVVAAAEICGAFVTAKANLPPSRCGTSRRRGRSPRRSQTLTFPLSGSQGKAVWPLGKAEKEASGRVSATVFITTVLEKAAMSIEVNAMFQRDR